MPLFRPSLRRALVASSAVIIVVLLAGATYQGVATALERREFPRPGGLVSVGDHQLHIYCTGTGSPTAVLEAPAAGLSAAWGDVQRRLSGAMRVCSYDRAGLGWSESGDRPFAPARVPAELRTLLTRINERGPFVIAGQGLGAAFARMYAARPDSEPWPGASPDGHALLQAVRSHGGRLTVDEAAKTLGFAPQRVLTEAVVLEMDGALSREGSCLVLLGAVS